MTAKKRLLFWHVFKKTCAREIIFLANVQLVHSLLCHDIIGNYNNID